VFDSRAAYQTPSAGSASTAGGSLEQAKVEQEWLRCVASGQPMELDHRLRGANGAYRWFHVRVQPFIDEQGRVLRWYGLLTDIDDQRTAEEAPQWCTARRLQQFARPQTLTTFPVTGLGFAELDWKWASNIRLDPEDPTCFTVVVVASGRAHNA
jgi:hypothetical protein